MSTLEMTIEELADGEVVLLHLHGVLDSYTYEELDEQLESLFADGQVRIVLDMSGLVRLTSAGAGTLASRLKMAREAGGELAVLGPPPRIQEILDMLGLNNVFPSFPSLEDTVAHLTTK